MGPKLQVTKDYSIFEYHKFNRPIHDNPRLLASMKKYAWMPSHPMQCIRGKDGKLIVKRGHHRLEIAKQLGIGVWYVIDESGPDNPGEMEPVEWPWSLDDYATAYWRTGDKDYAELLSFRKTHHLTLRSAASLLAGESASSHNQSTKVKAGSFKVGNTTHGKVVVSITDRCRNRGVIFATQTAFVSAVSLAVRVPELDEKILLHRIEMDGAKLRKRGTVNEYLEEIDALYNYAAKKRIPLAFRAREVSKQRQDTFGKGK